MADMEVQLYVYDLSQGLARQMSSQFLGMHIDAVYHTSLVFDGVEYLFGRGVMTAYPGQTHHGRPMEVISLGKTSLPMDVILDYLESLKEVYTAASYDLFTHNCNNFTNDFSMFLVGRGIPDHITTLPRRVLETPFGQMLRSQIDQAMRPITQAPPPRRSPAASRDTLANGSSASPAQPSSTSRQPPNTSTQTSITSTGLVRNVTNLQQLKEILDEAKSSCAVVFFTSATCGPCKAVYPLYDELAAEAGGKAHLVKVDISVARDVAMAYAIRATPTFITFLKGEQQDTWTGGDPAQLRGNIRVLTMTAHPPHPHEKLKLPNFSRQSTGYITYSKVPPLEKLQAKMGDAASRPEVQQAVDFLGQRGRETPETVPVPNLVAISAFLRESLTLLPEDTLFVSYDLLRLVLLDPRIRAWFTREEGQQTLRALFDHANNPERPYNLRLCAIHAACNLFTPKLKTKVVLSLAPALVTLVSACLLDESHAVLRAAATSLALNICTLEHLLRRDSPSDDSTASHESLPQVELAASLIEALNLASDETLKPLALALGRLVYRAPVDGEVLDLCRAMEAGKVLGNAEVQAGDRALVREIAEELLTKGLQ